MKYPILAMLQARPHERQKQCFASKWSRSAPRKAHGQDFLRHLDLAARWLLHLLKWTLGFCTDNFRILAVSRKVGDTATQQVGRIECLPSG
ncbi:hypothetical protein GPROT2_01619 [Gammaproteobacteria bacterium]|nr:hypothetical protein GPROT2_01619 [Gammaproteobacteria bacterium]